MNSMVFRVAFSSLKLVAPNGVRNGSVLLPKVKNTLSFGVLIRAHDLAPFAEIVGSLSCQFFVSIFFLSGFLCVGLMNAWQEVVAFVCTPPIHTERPK